MKKISMMCTAAAVLAFTLAGCGDKRPAEAPARNQLDLRTYGVGAQILRDIGIAKMRLLGSPRRMPSMTGYGLEVTGFVAANDAAAP